MRAVPRHIRALDEARNQRSRKLLPGADTRGVRGQGLCGPRLHRFLPRIPSAVVPLADKARPILYVELNWLVTRAERPHLVADGRHQNVSAIEVLLRQLDRLPLRQKSVGPAISSRG